MIKVLLTDNDDRVLVVRCEDQEEAEQVGRAAIYSTGGVSAWQITDVPSVAVSETLLEELRGGSNLEQFVNGEMETVPEPEPVGYGVLTAGGGIVIHLPDEETAIEFARNWDGDRDPSQGKSVPVALLPIGGVE